MKRILMKSPTNEKLRRIEIANLKSKGTPVPEIAKMYGVSRQAIYQLLKKAQKEGIKVKYNNCVKKDNICHICNKTFNGSSKQKTCSNECKALLRKQFFAKKESKWSRHSVLELVCDNCSKKFIRTKYLDSISKYYVKHKKIKNNYCSLDCYHNRNR